MPKKATIQEIIKGAKSYLPHVDEKRLIKAYEFAKKAHKGIFRDSGDPYIQHPLESAKILLDLRPDEDRGRKSQERGRNRGGPPYRGLHVRRPAP